MKLLLAGSCLFLLAVVVTEGIDSPTKITNSKEAEKLSYPKKVNSIKKNILKTSLKKIANITDRFRDLPADDLAFIKELDKQFKLHGGKVKIKVENNNGTESKNSKRTIDGDLGYGYAHNGYQYNPPKYMFYPYSQQNIGQDTPQYFLAGDGKTDVSIEPSYSYELKSQTYIAPNKPQIDVPRPKLQKHTEAFPAKQSIIPKQQQYEEPVIVLRIPGPAKYATHLQMLLQKYLEIRAAQYLHILEEAEQRNHQLQQLDYGHGNNAIAGGPIEHVEQHQQYFPIAGQHDYTQQIQHDHQNAMSPQLAQYPEIDNVYHGYKNTHSSYHEHTQQLLQDTQPYYALQQSKEEQHAHQYEHQPQHQQEEPHQYQQQQLQYQQEVQEQPQFYYAHPESSPANAYHKIYLVSMVPQGQQDYGAESQEPIYVQNQPNHNEHSPTLPIAENNPRPSHTKVIFTNKNEHAAHDYQMYQLPSIKPNERHPPTSKPDYHQDFQQHAYQHLQGKQTTHDHSANYQRQYNAADPTSQEVVTITQRPFNYHAHSVKAPSKGRTAHSRRAVPSKDTDNGLQQVREFERDKPDAQTGSAVEFKTT